MDLYLPAGTSGGGSAPDATTSTKGLVQLAGDLAGTAAAPTVPGKEATANKGAANGYAGLDATSRVASANLPARANATKTTGSIAAAANETGSMNMLSPTSRMFNVQASAPCRVQLYVSAAARTADVGRASGTAPAYDAGVILDVTLTDTATHTFNNPITGATSGVTNQWPYRITNTAGSAAAITVTINAQPVE